MQIYALIPNLQKNLRKICLFLGKVRQNVVLSLGLNNLNMGQTPVTIILVGDACFMSQFAVGQLKAPGASRIGGFALSS